MRSHSMTKSQRVPTPVLRLSWLACAAAISGLVGCDDGGAESAPDGGTASTDGAVDLDATLRLTDGGPPSTDDGAAGGGRLDAEVEVADTGPTDVVRALALTVNRIPPNMASGTAGRYDDAPVELLWAVPPAGWTIEVTAEHGGDWVPEGPPRLIWRSVTTVQDPHVFEGDQLDPPDGAWTATEDGHEWSAQVVTPAPGEPGRYTLQAALPGVSAPTLPLGLAQPDDDILPLESEDPWLLTLSRDGGRLTVEVGEGGVPIVRTVGDPDGVPDLEEALEALGMLGSADGWREALLAEFRARLLTQMRALFLQGTGDPAPINVGLYFEGDPEVPADWREAGWSAMAIGGEDPDLAPDRIFFGRAGLDWNNRGPNDNTGPRRGVFTTAFVRFALGNEITRTLLSQEVPALGGTPFGDRPIDLRFLEPGFDPASVDEATAMRFARLTFALDTLTLAVASTAAHEMGHSLGMVKPGPPPTGLLAGVDGPWVEAPVAGEHVDTEGFNLMQSGTSFSFADVARGAPSFNAANLAYLRGRILVLDAPLPGSE